METVVDAKAEETLAPENCNSCRHYFRDGYCNQDKTKIDKPDEVICNVYERRYNWTKAEFLESFQRSKNYVVIKHLRGDIFLLDRLYRNKGKYYTRGRLQRAQLPLWNAGNRIVPNDVINIGPDNSFQVVANIQNFKGGMR